MRFPSGWRRQLGREACAYAQEFFEGDTELAGQGGKLNASGVMLLVSSLVSEVRLLQREQEAARQEAAESRQQALREQARAVQQVAESHRLLEEERADADARVASSSEKYSRLLHQAQTAEERAEARVPQLCEEYYCSTLELRVKQRTAELEEELEKEVERGDFLEGRLLGRMYARSSA